MPNLRPENNVGSRYQIALLAWLLLLSACQSAPDELPRTSGNVPALPAAPAFTVDAGESEIRVLVRRAGPLAVLGHNHVLVAPVRGVIHTGDSSRNSGFRLEVVVNEFIVDPPPARAAEGADFSSAISAAARKGTRENALGEKLLDAERYPRIVLQSLDLHGPRWNPAVRARLLLRGVEKDIEFPAAVFIEKNALLVIAQFTVRQSDFGIEPFSIMGGALSVQDEVLVRVRIVAHAQ